MDTYMVGDLLPSVSHTTQSLLKPQTVSECTAHYNNPSVTWTHHSVCDSVNLRQPLHVCGSIFFACVFVI